MAWNCVCSLVLRYALTVSSFVFSHIAAFDLLYRIRVKITKHIGRLPMGFWGNHSSGQVLKIVQEDVEAIESFVAHHFPDAAAGLTLPFATLIFLFIVDWRLALAAAIPLPVTIIPMAYFTASYELKSFCGENNGTVCTASNSAKLIEYYLRQHKSIFFTPMNNIAFNAINLLNIPDEDVFVLSEKTSIDSIPGDKKMYVWDVGCYVHSDFKVNDIRKVSVMSIRTILSMR